MQRPSRKAGLPFWHIVAEPLLARALRCRVVDLFVFCCFLYLHFSWHRKMRFSSDSRVVRRCKYVALATLLWSPKIVQAFFLFLHLHPTSSLAGSTPWVEKKMYCLREEDCCTFGDCVWLGLSCLSLTKHLLLQVLDEFDFCTGCRAFAEHCKRL